MLADWVEREDSAHYPGWRIGVEVLAVAAGLKPSGRFTASRPSAEQLIALLEGQGLSVATYTPSPAEWGYRRATSGERRAASERDIRVYYARERGALELVHEAQKNRNDPALGEALGYPSCCIAANELLGRLPMTDMVRVARCAGAAPDWRLNIFLTELEIGEGCPYYLVSHFPCSLSCPASIAYAERVRSALERSAPRFAANLEALLRLPVLLRDERQPPEERRYGNSGAILHGTAIAGVVVYQGWSPLRRGDDLNDAGLGTSGSIEQSGAVLHVRADVPEAAPSVLDRERWALVAFA